ncbi:hypothetical protein FOZ60_001889 [Perkinsus olseni]|uniref:PUM-HD domain-containing protein n=1 Tax=Perkinsus olseni TaxID=32597 RepID=A0A7J6PJT6_PEROL|nr:hypothetical protein FOZ60_001889 [Perkinsus olseni]
MVYKGRQSSSGGSDGTRTMSTKKGINKNGGHVKGGNSKKKSFVKSMTKHDHDDHHDGGGGEPSSTRRRRSTKVKDNTSLEASVSQQRRVIKEKAIRKHDPNWEDRRRLNRLYSTLINNTRNNDDDDTTSTSSSKKKKSDMVDDILKEMISTKGINNYILNHAGSRIVQACMKYGTTEQRKRILTTLSTSSSSTTTSGDGSRKELEDAILQGKAYGMLAIERLISYGIKTDKKLTIESIIKPLLGDRNTVERLFIHRVGCRFLSTMYTNTKIPSQYRRRIFTIVSNPPSSDIKVISDEDDDVDNKKVLEHRMKVCRKAVDKELLDNGALVHKLFLSTLEVSDAIGNTDDIIKELLLLTNEGATRLLSSREGSLVFCRMFGYATAKQKKVLIKECKGNFKALATNAVDAIVVIRMLQCTDDTVLLSKTILQEILTPTVDDDDNSSSSSSCMRDMLTDQYGHLVLLYALGERRPRFYPQCYRQIMDLPKPLSVKDDEVRRTEIRSKIMNSMKRSIIINAVGDDDTEALYRLILDKYSSVVLLYLCCSLGKYDNDITITKQVVHTVLLHHSGLVPHDNDHTVLAAAADNKDTIHDIPGEIVSFLLVLILKSESVLVKNTTCDILKEYLKNIKICQLATTRWAFILKSMIDVLSRKERSWIINKVKEEGIDNVKEGYSG